MSKQVVSKSFKVALRKVGRGEEGKDFFISTFRFPLKRGQAIERRAKAAGLSLSQVINQVLQAYIDATPEPDVKVERTAEPTLWGEQAKAEYAARKKGKGSKKAEKLKKAKKEARVLFDSSVEDKKAAAKGSKKAEKLKKAKKAKRAEKPDAADKPEVKKASPALASLVKKQKTEEPKSEAKKPAAASVLAKLGAKKKAA